MSLLKILDHLEPKRRNEIIIEYIQIGPFQTVEIKVMSSHQNQVLKNMWLATRSEELLFLSLTNNCLNRIWKCRKLSHLLNNKNSIKWNEMMKYWKRLWKSKSKGHSRKFRICWKRWMRKKKGRANITLLRRQPWPFRKLQSKIAPRTRWRGEIRWIRAYYKLCQNQNLWSKYRKISLYFYRISKTGQDRGHSAESTT